MDLDRPAPTNVDGGERDPERDAVDDLASLLRDIRLILQDTLELLVHVHVAPAHTHEDQDGDLPAGSTPLPLAPPGGDGDGDGDEGQ